MPLKPRPHPAAKKHGELVEVLPGLHFVQGTFRAPGPLPVRFSRNMVAIARDGRVVLVNSVRLDDAGLAALDKLGKVTDVIRIAGNHGADDPFYAEHYGAKVWVVKGQRYTPGFETNSPDTYFEPTGELEAGAVPVLDGARLVVVDARPTEGLLFLPDHSGGTLIAGDCFQNWATADAYFNLLGRGALRMLGFMKPHNVGPAWFKNCKPPQPQLRGLLDLPFANVLPAHGAPVVGDGVAKYRAAVDRVAPGEPTAA